MCSTNLETRMLKRLISYGALLGLPILALANETPPADAASAPPLPSPALNDFCLISGAPPSDFKYTRIRDVKLGKGSYGSVRDILDDFVADARSAGADAVINYQGSQRFGFVPWRLVRPVVRGVAIKWEGPAPSCKDARGSTLGEVLATNVAPDKADKK